MIGFDELGMPIFTLVVEEEEEPKRKKKRRKKTIKASNTPALESRTDVPIVTKTKH